MPEDVQYGRNCSMYSTYKTNVMADCSMYFIFDISRTLEALTFGTDDCRCGIRVPDFSTKVVRNPSHFGYVVVGILVR